MSKQAQPPKGKQSNQQSRLTPAQSKVILDKAMKAAGLANVMPGMQGKK